MNTFIKIVCKPAVKIINFKKIYFDTWQDFYDKNFPKNTPIQEKGVLVDLYWDVKDLMRELQSTPIKENASRMEKIVNHCQIFRKVQNRLTCQYLWQEYHKMMLQDFLDTYEKSFYSQYDSLEPESEKIFQKTKESFFYNHMLPEFYEQVVYDLEDIRDLLTKNGFSMFAENWFLDRIKWLMYTMRHVQSDKLLFKSL